MSKKKFQPPPLCKNEPVDEKDGILHPTGLADWQEGLATWDFLCMDLKLRGDKETQIIKVEAEQLYKAVQVYNSLVCGHVGTLKEHTHELLSNADNLDKVSKGTKIAGITGGATTATGAAAAVAGVILAPFTFGASLALTAVGVGVATAGGVTGASAAIANKVNVTQDKKKIEKTLQEYKYTMAIIQDCLKFVNEGIERLQRHDLSVLNEAKMDSERVASAIKLASSSGASVRAVQVNSNAAEVMESFTLDMGIYFTQKKSGPKLKKGLASKFAKKIRNLAKELDMGLDELMQIKDLFSEHCLVEQGRHASQDYVGEQQEKGAWGTTSYPEK